MMTGDNPRTFGYPRWGLAGASVIVLASLAAAIPYRGLAGEAYSPLNHFVSELGQEGASELAAVFNAGLIGGGLLLAAFMVGLGAYLENPVAYAASAVGVFSALACSLVGVFPMNHLRQHVVAAMWFFRSGMAAIALFSLAVAVDRKRKSPKWFVLPGILVTASFALFLFMPRRSMPSGTTVLDPSQFARPVFWWAAVLEWLVFVAVIGWIVLACARGLRRGQPQRSG
jgi:hypothetical membrane protein